MRQDARRALRRFESDGKIEGTYRVFTTPEDLPDFLRLAATVSEKTYQHKLLGMGITDNAAIRRALTLAAENGWFRSLIVMLGNEPAAFKYGFLFNGTYYSELVGYDPRWAPYAVGTVAYLLTIRDLIGVGAKIFDFKYGDHGNKERMSNYFREEQNIYLIPRRFPLSALAAALRAFNATADWVGNLLEKFGLKSRIRKFLRRLSSRPSP
jgi:CelD/BcsL family acetyltransferase involved in cellulose biosynthesis